MTAVARRAPLSREAIVDAAIELLDQATEASVAGHADDRLTMRRLGDALGADPTAMYRHFRDKSDLLRAVGDRLLRDVTAGLDERSDPQLDADTAAWRDTVVTVCLRLREAMLRRPHLADAVRDAPPLESGEFAITEALLAQFLHAGLSPTDAALAYHSVIELTVGSATIDAAVDALDAADRDRRYDRWRRAYADLPSDRFPASTRVADALYRGTAAERFTVALGHLLDGILAGT